MDRLTFLLVFALVTICNADQWTEKIRAGLLKNYDKLSRPNEWNKTTSTQLGLTVTHIDVDELRSLMIVDGWVKMSWTDVKLKWDPPAYGGVTEIHSIDTEIWIPDVVLYNSAAEGVDHYGHTQCIVYSNGSVLWVPPAQFQAYCDIDLRHWPRDVQNCKLKMGSWTHHVNQIDLQIMDDRGDSSEYMMTSTSEWQLLSLDAERHETIYPCCPDAYPDITFTLKIKRRSPNFLSLVFIPALVVTSLILAIFWLPPENTERVVLNALTALVICELHRTSSQKIPDASGQTPFILVFYSTSLAIAALSLIISVISINISRTAKHIAPPGLLKTFFSGFISKILCLNPQVQRGKEGSGGDNYTNEWLFIARSIDRFAFYLFIILFIIIAIALA